MTEHPDYPQDYEKLPSLKFIVEQVSKVEDVSNCSTGYYAAQKKTADKIEKLNVLLGQLTQTTGELKKIMDEESIEAVLGKKTDAIQETIYNGISNLSSLLSAEMRGKINSMVSDQQAMIRTIDIINERSKLIQNYLHERMGVTIKKLDDHINEIHNELITPLWMNGWFWFWIFIAIVLTYVACKGVAIP